MKCIIFCIIISFLNLKTTSETILFTPKTFFPILEENNQYFSAPGFFLLDPVSMLIFTRWRSEEQPWKYGCFCKRDRKGDLPCNIDTNHARFYEQIECFLFAVCFSCILHFFFPLFDLITSLTASVRQTFIECCLSVQIQSVVPVAV